MKRYRLFAGVVLIGFFLAVPGRLPAEEEKAADTGSREILKERIGEKKEKSESMSPEEKEARQKELQRRRQERKQLGSQYKEAAASLTDEQKEAIRGSLASMGQLTPMEKALIKRMLKHEQLELQNLSPQEKEELMGKLRDFAQLSPLEKDEALRKLINKTN